MKRVERLLKIEEAGIVAVIRSQTKEEGLRVSHTLLDNGIKGIEVTLTTPNALEIMKELQVKYSKQTDIIIGAGTVIDKEMAGLAIQAGAEFIVSPVFDQEVCQLCHLYQLPYIPGCMTVNEMKQALSFGVDIVKLFPSNTFQPSILSSIHAPLPQLNIMPSGGVTFNNMEKWFQEGATVISVGGDLTNASLNTEELAKKYKSKLAEIKN